MDPDERPHRHESIPIPSYDEATACRSSSSTSARGAEQASDDAERQELLGQDGQTDYAPPTVESARSSLDSDLRLPEVGDGDDVRRHIEELDYLDPAAPDASRRSPRLYHRARLRSKWWTQQVSNLSATFHAMRMPSLRALYTPVSTASLPATDPTPPSRLTWLTRITQRVRIPERLRLSAPTFARLCGLLTLIGFVYIVFALDLFPGKNRHRAGAQYDPESVRAFVQDNVNAGAIEGFLKHITSFDHVAGTEGDLYLVKWMQEYWHEHGGLDEVALLPYYVYLDYPAAHRRSIKKLPTSGGDGMWSEGVEEGQVYSARQQTLAWHAYSKSGEAQGHLVYANKGTKEDFEYLRDHGINTTGSIALMVKSDDLTPQIKAAEAAGCVAALVYSNPGDATAGSWQAPGDMLHRGSMIDSNLVLGDPLTPGVPSTKDAMRLDSTASSRSISLPGIPSLPLSWHHAQRLIGILPKHGVSLPADWNHAPADFSLTSWWSGTDTASDADAPVIHLQNLNDANPTQQIWNLHGLIEGMESPEKKVYIGNHRDSFCFGAADPGSGSAVMMELVSIFGQLRKMGWRPLRSIEFVSWDAGAYNSIGSTEYVEENVKYLRKGGVAYLNVGAGVFGSEFRASGSPMWQRSLLHVLDRVSDPRSNNTSTLRPVWQQKNGNLEGLSRADGDFAPFQYIAGASSLDFGFQDEDNSFPEGSCYDTFEWMAEFGDPDGLQYHKALAQIWALLILEVADRPLLPFDLRIYADAIKGYIDNLDRDAESKLDVSPLRAAVEKMRDSAQRFHHFEDIWTANVFGSGGLETTQYTMQRFQYNHRLALFESNLLDLQGLAGREQFKHVVLGPLANGGKGGFPGVRDAMEAGNWTGAQAAVAKAAQIILGASADLVK